MTIKQHEIRMFNGQEETTEQEEEYKNALAKLSKKELEKWEKEKATGARKREEVLRSLKA